MRKLILLLLVLGLCGAYAVVDWVNRPGNYSELREVQIFRGETSQTVARKLAEKGIIEKPWLFRAVGRFNGLDKKLKAGEYCFEPQMSLLEVMEKIVAGDVLYRRVTLPEGLTTVQMLDILREQPYLDGEITLTPQEGELMPETYSFVRGDSRNSIVLRAQKAMEETIARVWETRDSELPLKTPQELLILASIVEKETGVPEERGLVASVFVNRLRKRMLLQTDPTVIYALTGGKSDLGRLLTRQDLQVDNPYNTYKYAGLPPTPICNPGREALEAAARPESSDYLYFVASGNGGHNFARSLAEHNRNVQAWKKQR